MESPSEYVRRIDELTAHLKPSPAEPSEAAWTAVGYGLLLIGVAYCAHCIGMRADLSDIIGLAAVWLAARADSSRRWRRYHAARRDAALQG